MPKTIEVPISLIQAGDIDAIRDLLPKENLFGRWATHYEYGRGIIISAHPGACDDVWFIPEQPFFGGTTVETSLKALTLDPVELTTVEDFENAPHGTVVVAPKGNSYQKVYKDRWESYDVVSRNADMSDSGPWKILRWGW